MTAFDPGIPRDWLRLSTGRRLTLRDPAVPGLDQRYWVLYGEDAADLDATERAELLAIGDVIARHLAAGVLGDPECYSLLLNGARTRRTRGEHVHILLSVDLAEKRRHFIAAQLKQLSRPAAAKWAAARAAVTDAVEWLRPR
ncbi:MAG: hypothetical protein H6701_14050 [Myxococcales bacterium]|nr:hypothetical protein [Myxococcales bacterium]